MVRSIATGVASFLALSLELSVGAAFARDPFTDFSPAAAVKKLAIATSHISIPRLEHSVEGELVPIQAHYSGELHTQRFQHTVGGIEVLGSQVLRHTQLGSVQGFLGLNDPTVLTDRVAHFDLDLKPVLSMEQALQVALLEAPGQNPSIKPRLLVIPNKTLQSAKLVYRVEIAGQGTIEGRVVDVDAHNGRMLASVSRHWEIAPVDVFSTTPRCQVLAPIADELGGRAPVSVEHLNCRKVVKAGKVLKSADEKAKRALANSQKVLNYYWENHKRDSYDNMGSTLTNIVHVGDRWTNAYWDSENAVMAYGDGDGAKFKNLTLSVDVAGHEMTHGVVSKTANLEYQSESGAANEGLADFFGESIEGQQDWVMGRELFVDPVAGENGLRNLVDPSKTTYRWKDADGKLIRKSAPKHYSEIFKFGDQMCGRMNDNCGVHMNATLIGHTGYLLVQKMGREKAEKVFYTTLVHFLTETSDFKEFGVSARKACGTLYSEGECADLDSVLNQVGL
ncbi:MAG: M4 family metallopeptidase [Oligoflexia bacterium]